MGPQAGAAAAPVVNDEAVNKLADALANLRVLRVADGAPASDEAVVLEIKSGETTLTYRFTKVDANHYVQRSDKEQVFTLSEADFNTIAGQDVAGLTAAPATEAIADPAAASSTDTGSAATNGQIAPAG